MRGRDMARMVTVMLAIGFAGGTAFAERVQELKPPTDDKPPPGTSPGTGQQQPNDPTDVTPIDPPTGKPCGIDGQVATDQSHCDSGHGPNNSGGFPGNTPPMTWYQDMYGQLYNMQSALTSLNSWASAAGQQNIAYYAQWMLSTVGQVGNTGFMNGAPIQYPFGYMTRGDFDYDFYYWIRPLYWNLVYQAQTYAQAFGANQQYQQVMTPVVAGYQSLAACMFGFNGKDKDALRDYEARAEEHKAGIHVGS